MAKKKMPPDTLNILQKHGLSIEDCWDCHGTWVIYHKALERVAASQGIRFEEPQIICSDMEKKLIAIRVTGYTETLSEWSIGEAAPYNNKNAYPFAMAEKRAKDRVILKLLGLHGEFYSEEEADDFKASRPDPGELAGPLTKTELKNKMREMAGVVANLANLDEYEDFMANKDWRDVMEQCARDMPQWWDGKEGSDVQGMSERIFDKKTELRKLERGM